MQVWKDSNRGKLNSHFYNISPIKKKQKQPNTKLSFQVSFKSFLKCSYSRGIHNIRRKRIPIKNITIIKRKFKIISVQYLGF